MSGIVGPDGRSKATQEKPIAVRVDDVWIRWPAVCSVRLVSSRELGAFALVVRSAGGSIEELHFTNREVAEQIATYLMGGPTLTIKPELIEEEPE